MQFLTASSSSHSAATLVPQPVSVCGLAEVDADELKPELTELPLTLLVSHFCTLHSGRCLQHEDFPLSPLLLRFLLVFPLLALTLLSSGVAGGLDEVSRDGAAVEEVGTVAAAAQTDTSSRGVEEGDTAGGGIGTWRS